MESFRQWICDIAIYMILVTLIYRLSANSSYKPYIKLITGLLMIVLIAKPVVSFSSQDFEKYLERETTYYQIESARMSQNIYEEKSKEMILASYEEEIKAQIKEKVEEYGLFLQNADITFGTGEEYGVIKEVSVTASYDKNPDIILGEITLEDSVASVPEIKMAQWICENFNVEQEHIDITIKK